MAKISFSFPFFVVCLFINCYAFEGRETAESTYQLHDFTHTIQLSSLLPSTVCDSASKADEKKSSLKVVHRHGPCFQLNQDKAKSPSHVEIIRRDQLRVNSIHSKIPKNSHGGGDINETDAANIPAKDGGVIWSPGEYIVTVGLGTPKKDLSLIFDTGSTLTWTQCEPCVVGMRHCYKQKEPRFDPRVSKTYSNISCSASSCHSVASAEGNTVGCESSRCLYTIQYTDSSSTKGFVGKETLTLTPTDVFPNFLFGCGQNNGGLFSGVAGLIGLGPSQISLVSQTAQKYNKLFSYCLPSSSSSIGHLTFGNGGCISKSVKFTPLSTKFGNSSFYFLDVTAISVGGRKLSIPTSVFSSSGTIIDSGTTFTRLQPRAYSALRSAFRQMMTQYPKAPAFEPFDTCFDFTNYNNISAPIITFSFNGGTDVSIDKTGVFHVINNSSQVCLAFAPSGADEMAIFGNVQQKRLEVVYDVARGRVGFAPGGCK